MGIASGVTELDGLVIQLDVKSYRERYVAIQVPTDALPVLRESLVPTMPVAVEMTISRARDKWRAQGTLCYRTQQACVRCLESFQSDRVSRVDRLFRIGIDPLSQKKNAAMDDELTWLGNGELAVLDLVQEEILLDMPMTPICSDECLGLCPSCGCNRNQSGCHCEGKIREGPFSRLKELKLS
ncbi:MAG: DUF177 domain-containing protein [Magnetococcales bacterium]|nr:DUF177 domain-containing protein [Magnetococcales bacterium]